MDERLPEPTDERLPEPTAQRSRFNSASRHWLRSARPWDRFAYVIRVLPAAIERAARDLDLRPGARVLDFGCAEKPYRDIFPDDISYVGADLAGNPSAEVEVSNDGRLPLEDDSFDAVLSTQVLEHVRRPATYLSECFRVLGPGGRLLLSTHGTMILHPDPIDLWRWTSDGLRHEIERAGLRVVSFSGVVGLSATGLQLFQDATYGHMPRLLRPPYGLLMQVLIALCDRLHSDRSRSLNALVYTVVAEKPRRIRVAP